MAGEAKPTTDHDEVPRWVEERGGRPAPVKETGGDGDPGILRIDYPGVGEAQPHEGRFSKLVSRKGD